MSTTKGKEEMRMKMWLVDYRGTDGATYTRRMSCEVLELLEELGPQYGVEVLGAIELP